MPQAKRYTNEQIIAAYKETGSVWRAAKALGACGQSVWERLTRMGYALPTANWTNEELAELTALGDHCTIAEISRRLGRSFASVACKLSELGIYVRRGKRLEAKVKRGSGLTKAVMAGYLKEIRQWNGSLRKFCIQRGIDIELFVQTWQRLFPESWEEYVHSHSDLQVKECPYCSRKYVPMTEKQTTCSRKCTTAMRNDRQYFGGKRKLTIGLSEGICQLCEREKASLSSHHIFGKENDPDNDYLIALCQGCHKLVGVIAPRSDIKKPEFFENLIGLALARKFGERRPLGFHVAVSIDELAMDDVAAMTEQNVQVLSIADAATERRSA